MANDPTTITVGPLVRSQQRQGPPLLAPAVGDFVCYSLVTDTRVFEVTKVTAKTITVRTTLGGDQVASENRDGNPYPVVWTEALSDPHGIEQVLRRRQDGTFRMGDGASPLRPSTVIDGKPVTFTDYRY